MHSSWNQDPSDNTPVLLQIESQLDMEVRDRRRSISQPQQYGRVQSIKGNKVKFVWDSHNKEKEEVFDMVEDTEILSLIISEI